MWNGLLAGVNGWCAALVVAPALAVCIRPTQRRLLWVVLPALAAFWMWFMFQTRGTTPSVGEFNSSAAFRPVRIGPSYLSVLDLSPWPFQWSCGYLLFFRTSATECDADIDRFQCSIDSWVLFCSPTWCWRRS
jgi:hypothetical protein